MRHVYASALIAAGESVKTVQRRMEHSSEAVTVDVFVGAAADSARTAGRYLQV
jgi:hypothetical protein